MKVKFFGAFAAACMLVAGTGCASSNFDLTKAVSAGQQALQAMTLSDADMAAYCKESVDYMDKNNNVCGPKDPYTIRLNRLTDGITDVNGIPLNFKVYKVTDVNAFACPDGSVRVFSALMDIMDDDELMGILGHEIGHVGMHHSKKQFQQQLMTGALKDALGATSGTMAALTSSQLSALGESLMSARYSQKQEKEADNAGYDFLVANGRNPWGMVKSFEKLQALEGSNGQAAGYFQKMFSSHPDTAERIKLMTNRCKKDGYKRN